jgi:hypothetical protein
MKTNKTAVTILILLVILIATYSWYMLSQPDTATFDSFQNVQVEKIAEPEITAVEEVSAVSAVETSLDQELDALEAKPF